MKPLLTTLALLMIYVIYLCNSLLRLTDFNERRLNRLVIDSIHTHHVIKRQNEMILDFQKYGNLYNIKEENNCFTNNKN